MLACTIYPAAAMLMFLSAPALAQTPNSPLAGRWQYLQPPDTEGEILDLAISAAGSRGVMNGLERTGDHGLFYYVSAIEGLVLDSDGGIRFEVGARSLFRQRPTLSELGGEGDAGVSRTPMSFIGYLDAGDLVLQCTGGDGSCPDSVLRFEKLGAPFGAVSPSVAQSQEFRAWVGLYAPGRLGWLENENRVAELCASSNNSATCYGEMLAPAIDIYALYAAPDESSAQVGDLIIAAVPGRGLSAHFRPMRASATVSFVPDLFLQDWGYGAYFHQTITQQQGDWFQLPPDPWETTVWLHRADQREQTLVIGVRAEDIIEVRGRGMTVVAAENDSLLVREEQPADLWCQEGAPPALVAVEPVRLSRAELLDDRGHLIIAPKYLKGC